MNDDPEITDPRDPYKRPDIVTELDRWLVSRASLHEATVSHALLQGARDEIVALREMREAHIRILSSRLDEDEENMRRWIAKARNEALEEAAQRCDRLATDYTIPVSADNWSAGCRGCAARVRALKGER